MTAAESPETGPGSVERKPLATHEDIRKAFLEPSPSGAIGPAPAMVRRLPEGSSANGILEFSLAVTGLGLSVFMVMHLGLLLSVVLGAQTMDTLASFLERYYLLQATAPVLVVAIVTHVVLTLRRVPGSFQQQRLLLRVSRSMRHFDTFTWGIQLATGLAIAAFASIHLWIVLVDLPIEAIKSGTRVNGIYVWLYVPFLVAIESHISAGIYRIAVKWGISRRRLLHLFLIMWTVLVLGLGVAILVAFYRIGESA
ncbi:MAG: hypothetical protein V3S37_05035 [Dehalococcoidia bacterium]